MTCTGVTTVMAVGAEDEVGANRALGDIGAVDADSLPCTIEAAEASKGNGNVNASRTVSCCEMGDIGDSLGDGRYKG